MSSTKPGRQMRAQRAGINIDALPPWFPPAALTAVMCSKHAPVVAWSATGLAATFAQPPGWVRGPPPMLIGHSMSLSHVWMLLAFAHALGRVFCVLLSPRCEDVRGGLCALRTAGLGLGYRKSSSILCPTVNRSVQARQATARKIARRPALSAPCRPPVSPRVTPCPAVCSLLDRAMLELFRHPKPRAHDKQRGEQAQVSMRRVNVPTPRGPVSRPGCHQHAVPFKKNYIHRVSEKSANDPHRRSQAW